MIEVVEPVFKFIRFLMPLGAFVLVYYVALRWLWDRFRKKVPIRPGEKLLANVGPWAFLLALIGIGCMLYGWRVESKRLTVVQYRIESPKLARGEQVRVVCLADLHEREQGPREQALPGLVTSLNPDLIVYPGDFFTHAKDSAACAVRLLKSWTVPQFSCRGNRDDIADFDGTMKQAGVIEATATPHLLQVRGAKLAIVGFPFKAESEVVLSLGLLPKDTFNLVLYHHPDAFPETWGTRADLMVSGHLHGGQIRLPWWGSIFPRSECVGRWEGGCYTEYGTTLVVSRGLGCQRFMPEVRFLCPPEVVVIDVVGTAQHGS